jgi:hypothetical protein
MKVQISSLRKEEDKRELRHTLSISILGPIVNPPRLFIRGSASNKEQEIASLERLAIQLWDGIYKYPPGPPGLNAISTLGL